MSNLLAAGQPGSQGCRRANSHSRDVDESLHRPTGEIHRSNVRFSQSRFVRGFSHPHHQISPDDAATHATVAEKRKAAKHLSLGNIRALIEVASDAGRKPFVVGHIYAA